MSGQETKRISNTPESTTPLSKMANRLGQILYDNYVLGLFPTHLDVTSAVKEATKQRGLLGYLQDVNLGWIDRRRQVADAMRNISSSTVLETNRPEGLRVALTFILVDGALEETLRLAEIDQQQISEITTQFVVPDRLKDERLHIEEMLCTVSLAQKQDSGVTSLTKDGKLIAKSFLPPAPSGS